MATGELTKDISESSRFNPYLPDQNPPDFTNASRGAKSREAAPTLYAQHENTVFPGNLRQETDAPANHATYVRPVIVDNSKGILYEGLGKAAGESISLADELYKTHIRSEVQEQKDAVDAEFGVNAASDVYGNTSGPVPADLQKQTAYLNDLTQAYQSGTLRESSYWAKMDVVARSMRSRFPLYGEYVDKVVAGLTGNVPANALRRALENEATDGQENSPARKLEKLTDSVMKDTGLPPDFFTRKEAGKDYNIDELQQWYSNEKAKEHNMDSRKKEIELQDSEDSSNKKYVEDTARMEIWDKVQKTITGMNSTFGIGYEGIRDQYNKILSEHRLPSPDEQQQIRAQFGSLRSMIITGFQNTLMQDFPGTKLSYMKLLDKNAVDDLQGNLNTFLQNTEDALVNQHFGILGSTQAFLDSVEKGDVATLLSDDKFGDFARKQKAVTQILGPEGANTMLSQDTQGLMARSKMLSDITLTNLYTQGAKAPLADGIDKAWDSGNKDPKAYRDILSKARMGVIDQRYPTEARHNLVQGIFAKDFTHNFTQQEQTRYYEQYTAPDFVDGMKKLEDQGHPEDWQQYQTWVLSKFSQLNNTAVNDAKAAVENRPNMKLSWNDQTHQLEVATGSGKYASGLDQILEKTLLEPAATSSIEQINLAIRGLLPMFRADKQDVNEGVMKVFGAMGLDLNKPKTGSGLSNLYDYIGNAFHSFLNSTKQKFEDGRLLNDPEKHSETEGNTKVAGDVIPFINPIAPGLSIEQMQRLRALQQEHSITDDQLKYYIAQIK